MQLIGETIRHEQFGKGVVTALEHNIITIDFPTGVKRFVYPDAFEAFLVPKDGDTKEKINDLLVEQKLQEKQKELEDLEHQKKLAHLRAMKIPTNGQAIFDLDNQEDNDPFETGICKTGVYLSGVAKGENRVPQQMRFNSMCILTRCPEGKGENDREILGLAMVPEFFDGSACEDGIVPMDSEYRLKLKTPIKLWTTLKKEAKKSWGHAAFKYISNQQGEEILYELRQQNKSEDSDSEIQAFYRYYCDCNHLIHR